MEAVLLVGVSVAPKPREPENRSMTRVTVALAAAAVASLSFASVASSPSPSLLPPGPGSSPAAAGDNEVVEQYCVRCHNERRLIGNLSLEEFDAADPVADVVVAEKMIRKLRAGMMPPPGARRPDSQVLQGLAASMEDAIDAASAGSPNPGNRTFQRLNRAEYERAVHDLLGIEIDAAAYLPGETISAGFDNIADVQNLSATLLEAYLTAASEVSRLALGDASATPSESTYEVSRYAEQRRHVPGAPIGTRGGISIVHNFVADGEYYFRLAFQHESTGNFFGQTAPFDEHVEVSIDGARVALIPLDRWMHRQDPMGVEVVTDPIGVSAGPHRVSAAFLKAAEGPVEDLTSPHGWSLADKKIGYSYGITGLAHLRDMTIGGPYNVTGVSRTPAWERVATCGPGAADGGSSPSGASSGPVVAGATPPATIPGEVLACAREIASRLATRAFRRPVSEPEIDRLMELFDLGAEQGGFHVGVRTVLQGVLASPDFVFRFEKPAPGVRAGEAYPVDGLGLATRLSFFLWGRPPDAELVEAAADGRLSDPQSFDAQLERMLADPRAKALGTRFASQWLRLQDLEKVHPDALRYPDFYEQLAHDMRRETETFFNALVQEDGTLVDFLTADYSYMNERLARHYGVPGVAGDHFRKVEHVDAARRGVLGHGSILTLTSHANRTSPVLRGKWVMEVLLGSPPPPPPPDVPELDATAEATEGRFLTVRERMEEHRANPACNSCHRVIDPIGLALENFDVTGVWRIRDKGVPVETAGELYDGTPIGGPDDLRSALLRRPEPLARSFTENLLAYALGRRVEYHDMPAVRQIARAARAEEYKLAAFVKEVARSAPFRMAMAPAAVEDEQAGM